MDNYYTVEKQRYEKDREDLLILIGVLMRKLGKEEVFVEYPEVLEIIKKNYQFQAVPAPEENGVYIRVFLPEDKNDNV